MSEVLRSYKMTHDTGFAPNPFHNYLTLANCKASIRKIKDTIIGQWIAGFTSEFLCGHKVGEERLIFLMKVKEQLTYYHIGMIKDLKRKSQIVQAVIYQKQAIIFISP